MTKYIDGLIFELASQVCSYAAGDPCFDCQDMTDRLVRQLRSLPILDRLELANLYGAVEDASARKARLETKSETWRRHALPVVEA